MRVGLHACWYFFSTNRVELDVSWMNGSWYLRSTNNYLKLRGYPMLKQKKVIESLMLMPSLSPNP